MVTYTEELCPKCHVGRLTAPKKCVGFYTAEHKGRFYQYCSRHDFTKFSPCRYFDFTDSVQKQYEAGAFEPVDHEDRAFEAWLTSPETQAWLATDAVPPHPSQSAPSFMAPPRLFPHLRFLLPPSPLLPPHPLNVSRGCLAPSAASVTAQCPRAPQNSYTLGPAAASSSSLPTTPSSSVPANRVDPKAVMIDPCWGAKLAAGDYSIANPLIQTAAYKKSHAHRQEVWWWSENGQGAEVFDISVPHFPFFHPKDSTALVKFVGSQADVLDYAYWSGTRWTRTDIAVTVTGKTPLYLRSLNVSNCIDGPVAPVTPAKRKLSVVAGWSNSPSPQPSSQDHRPTGISPLVFPKPVQAFDDIIDISSDEDDSPVPRKVIKSEPLDTVFSGSSSKSKWPLPYFCDMHKGFTAMAASIAGGGVVPDTFTAVFKMLFVRATYYENVAKWERLTREERVAAADKGRTPAGKWRYVVKTRPLIEGMAHVIELCRPKKASVLFTSSSSSVDPGANGIHNPNQTISGQNARKPEDFGLEQLKNLALAYKPRWRAINKWKDVDAALDGLGEEKIPVDWDYVQADEEDLDQRAVEGKHAVGVIFRKFVQAEAIQVPKKYLRILESPLSSAPPSSIPLPAVATTVEAEAPPENGMLGIQEHAPPTVRVEAPSGTNNLASIPVPAARGSTVIAIVPVHPPANFVLDPELATPADTAQALPPRQTENEGGSEVIDVDKVIEDVQMTGTVSAVSRRAVKTEAEASDEEIQEEDVPEASSTSAWMGSERDFRRQNRLWDLVMYDGMYDSHEKPLAILITHVGPRYEYPVEMCRFNYLPIPFFTFGLKTIRAANAAKAPPFTYNVRTHTVIRAVVDCPSNFIEKGTYMFDYRLPGYATQEPLGTLAVYRTNRIPSQLEFRVGPNHSLPLSGASNALRVVLMASLLHGPRSDSSSPPGSDDDSSESAQNSKPAKRLKRHCHASGDSDSSTAPPNLLPLPPLPPPVVQAPPVVVAAPPVLNLPVVSQADQIHEIAVAWLVRLYGQDAVILELARTASLATLPATSHPAQSVTKLVEWLNYIHDLKAWHKRVPMTEVPRAASFRALAHLGHGDSLPVLNSRARRYPRPPFARAPTLRLVPSASPPLATLEPEMSHECRRHSCDISGLPPALAERSPFVVTYAKAAASLSYDPDPALAVCASTWVHAGYGLVYPASIPRAIRLRGVSAGLCCRASLRRKSSLTRPRRLHPRRLWRLTMSASPPRGSFAPSALANQAVAVPAALVAFEPQHGLDRRRTTT
ncbi:hypothetical protein DFH06DRAFT_1318106 [Mycena polygramma]|nr:hypothetical protein DFH06DRAFT_1318106 [Mycena polygramma]